ncbi:MAG TPA: metal ABC transporter substrate-binding protein [archaeon]|nr:metal ABC transporter substrate-binding protein [archaeon]
MKHFNWYIFLIFLANSALSCSRADPVSQPVVVATTTMIGSMVELLAQEKIELRVLVPPGSCPGHFDLKPQDAVRLSRASLIVRHDYQAYLDRKLKPQNEKVSIVALRSPGSLVIPKAYLEALSQLKSILSSRFPDLAPDFESNFALASQRIEEIEGTARKRIVEAELSRARILGSVMQEDFLRWVGMQVCASFSNSPDELSVLRLTELVRTAEGQHVDFVAGNLQSGGEMVAVGIAAEIGCPVCVLSNFPGTNERNSTYFELLLDNINLLAQINKETAQP